MKMYFVPEAHKDVLLELIKRTDGQRRPGAIIFVTPREMKALKDSHIIELAASLPEIGNGSEQ